ncbi:MAG: kinetochore-associated Ndc80 complex subunit ndc80 [Vezdaea aestivalis]|nr:MAG: kinetochore-associated Ndc80 complex subunit ndc80 [Vezdaea aestivalis]
MSHDTHLFSVRKPRETMGTLNPNSSIPQPASALKRASSVQGMRPNPQFTGGHSRSISGSRASLAPGRPSQPNFHRSNSGSNLSDLGIVPSHRQSISHARAGRMSYAPGATSAGSNAFQSRGAATMEQQQRRSSIYSRPSSMGTGIMGQHQSFFATGPVAAGVPRDPRPLRDRAFQARLGQELTEYLAAKGFEMEMHYSLSQNVMRSPTQKDFNYMFQWLYHRIDPAYRFQKSIDQEVPPILKQLRYPFEKSITKSQISAVGGQNWSTFLGLLHWMMQLAQMLDGFESGVYDDACADAGVDSHSERVIFRFLTSAYRDWLAVDDNGSNASGDGEADKVLAPHVSTMAAEFAHSNKRYLDELAMLEAENKALADQIAEVERATPDIAKLDKHFSILSTDQGKFEAYNASMESKASKYDARVALLTQELESAEQAFQAALVDRDSLQTAVDAHGLTVSDMDRLASERERLQRSHEATQTRLEDARKRCADLEAEATVKLDSLERAADGFNSQAYAAGLIPSTAPNANGVDFDLALTITQQAFSSSAVGDARLLTVDGTPHSTSTLLNLDLRETTRPALVSLRREIYDRRATAQEADIKARDLLEHTKEALEDKKAEVEALGHRVRAAEEEFERTRDVASTQKTSSDAQIERMEREVARMRDEFGDVVGLVEQKELGVNLEYEQLTIRANALREELHTEVERMLNDVIKFKVHVQKSLEDYEGFVVDEVEQELGNPEPEDDGEGEIDEAS